MRLKQARHNTWTSQEKTYIPKLKNERQKIPGAYNGKSRYKNYIQKKIFKEKRFDLQTL